MKNLIRTALVVAVVAACSESPLAPVPTVNLGTCTNLATPAAARQIAHTFAQGVQIYRWDGNTWALMSPAAVLTADEAGTETVGIHYQGPTWEGIAGSKVTAVGAANCTPDANSIPWLLLNATATGEAGVFAGTAFIHRVNTVGGRAPTAAGTSVGQMTSVPYTAEYFFYAAQ